MQIKQGLWQHTQMQQIINRGTGEIAYLLSKLHSDQINNLEPHAAAIIWRWWHKENGTLYTPAHVGEMITIQEDWPTNGMFYPRLSLKNKTVNIEVDYIALGEFPLLKDSLGNGQVERLGKYYEEVVKICRQNTQWIPSDDLESSVTNCRNLITFLLDDWYHKDSLECKVFSRKEWHEFWMEQLNSWNTIDGSKTDTLLDHYITWVRRKLPNWGLTQSEMDKLSAKAKRHQPATKLDIMKWQSQYYFWTNFMYFIGYPLASFVGLLSPLYIDQQMWEEDIHYLAQNKSKEPMTLFSPCTNISFTNFGKLVMMSYKNIEQRVFRV